MDHHFNQAMGDDQGAQSSEDHAKLETTECRRHTKPLQKAQKKLASSFTAAVDDLRREQEIGMQQSSTHAHVAKERRKALRNVLKEVTDLRVPQEERMKLLQDRFVALMHEQIKQDKQVFKLQNQLSISREESSSGHAELARLQQKADSLQKLARGLSTDNKLLLEENNRQKQHTSSVHSLLQDIQERIHDQQQETDKVLEHNKMLLAENGKLKAHLQSTQEGFDTLRTTQQDRLTQLAAQLEQQVDAMAQVQKLHSAFDEVTRQNQELVIKAELVDALEERNQALTKAMEDMQAQAMQHNTQQKEMQESLIKATQALKSFDKVHKAMSEHQAMASQLIKERQWLQQQLQLLQQQNHDQADKLRRTQLQKQRLEGLCRIMQARSGGSDSAPAPVVDAAQRLLPEDVQTHGQVESPTLRDDTSAAPSTSQECSLDALTLADDCTPVHNGAKEHTGADDSIDLHSFNEPRPCEQCSVSHAGACAES